MIPATIRMRGAVGVATDAKKSRRQSRPRHHAVAVERKRMGIIIMMGI
jgi:hypothetical protein